MAELNQAVLATLAYTGMFDQALTEDELRQLLFKYQLTDSDRLDQAFTGTKRQGTLLALASQKHLLNLKAEQQSLQQQKLANLQRWLWLFRLIPWIQLVAVTGSVAAGSPKDHDDIDLLIVTDSHRLWLSRILLLPCLSLLGKRRKPNHHPNRVSNKFCLNMWRSADDLREEHRDLYIAVELSRMIPVVNHQQAYQRYLKANKWMQELLPNFDINSKLKKQNPKQSSINKSKDLDDAHTKIAWSFRFWMLDLADELAKRIQLHLMRPRTNETVTATELKFHPRDYRQEILKKYQRRLEKLNFKDQK